MRALILPDIHGWADETLALPESTVSGSRELDFPLKKAQQEK